MIRKPYKESYVLWQEGPEDGVAEPALLIEDYNDVISVTQDGHTINLDRESVDELCRLLKKLKKNHG